jgi:phosphate transport system substrate-binding protein
MAFIQKSLSLAVALSSLSIAKAADIPTVKIDGSSTVYPIIEAISEEFSKANPKTRVTAGYSGTGGGFKKFIAGEIDICDASRPVKDAEKADLAKKGIKYQEIKIGYDGLSVIVNPSNTFVDYLSKEELAKIWAPESKVQTWADIRKEWPAQKIKLYGPGTDSGTFDFFTEVINGKAQLSRSDFTKSEDDNVLVQGVIGDKNAMAYLGHAYVEQNKGKLRAVPIGSSAKTAVEPNAVTIKNGTYSPLSRPLFIYVSTNSLKRKEVKEFVQFALKTAPKLVSEVGYVPLKDAEYQNQTKVLAR